MSMLSPRHLKTMVRIESLICQLILFLLLSADSDEEVIEETDEKKAEEEAAANMLAIVVSRDSPLTVVPGTPTNAAPSPSPPPVSASPNPSAASTPKNFKANLSVNTEAANKSNKDKPKDKDSPKTPTGDDVSSLKDFVNKPGEGAAKPAAAPAAATTAAAASKPKDDEEDEPTYSFRVRGASAFGPPASASANAGGSKSNPSVGSITEESEHHGADEDGSAGMGAPKATVRKTFAPPRLDRPASLVKSFVTSVERKKDLAPPPAVPGHRPRKSKVAAHVALLAKKEADSLAAPELRKSLTAGGSPKLPMELVRSKTPVRNYSARLNR